MESMGGREAEPTPLSDPEGNAAMCSSGLGVGKPDVSMRAATETEWTSIPQEGTSRTELENCFQFREEKQSSRQARNRELSMCRLSKLICTDGNDENEALVGYATCSKKDGTFISMESSDAPTGGKEVRLSFHGTGFQDGSESVVYKKGSWLVNDSGSILGYGDEGCLRPIHQSRAFVKGAKLSCSGFLSEDNRTFLSDAWTSLLHRSFSFKSSDTSSPESESLCKKSSALARTVSTPTLTIASVVSTGALDALKAGPLQARDPQSRAEALPSAHYRPTDGAIWKEGEGKTGQPSLPATSCKSPGHINCKKPPRHPGRSASLDSAGLLAQRSAKKSRDRASAKRKARTSSPTASTSVTPLVALVLTIGFGVLIVFQSVFAQTNVLYGRNTDRAFVDVATNLRSSFSAQRSVAHGYPYQIDPQLLGSSNVNVSKSEAVLSSAFRKSMEELLRSRSSLTSQAKSPRRSTSGVLRSDLQ